MRMTYPILPGPFPGNSKTVKERQSIFSEEKIDWQPSSRTDVFLSSPFNSSSFITLWGEPSNSWTFESTLLDQRLPVEHELVEYITPSTNSNYWQHTKCLHHGPRIYAEYILHCYRTTNHWQHAKCLHQRPHIYAEYIFHCYRTFKLLATHQNAARPFYTCFLLTTMTSTKASTQLKLH